MSTGEALGGQGYHRNCKYNRRSAQLKGFAPIKLETVSRTSDYRDLLSPETLKALNDYKDKLNKERTDNDGKTEEK